MSQSIVRAPLTISPVVVMVYSAHAFKLTNLLGIGDIKTESQLINIFGAAGDVVIAGAMIYLLHGSRTGFKASDGMINRLVRLQILLNHSGRQLMTPTTRSSS